MQIDSEPQFDWQAISKATILFILSCIMSIGLVWGSYAYFVSITGWKQKLDNQLQEVKKTYGDVQSSLDIVQQDYLSDYDALVEQQFYVESESVSFEEQLLELRDYTMRIVDKTKLDFQLFAADWHISEKSNEYRLNWMTNTPNCRILATEVHVSLASLHEGHILKSIDRFYGQPPSSLFNLKSCEMSQLSPIQIDNVSKPYFEANCIFSWYLAEKID